MRRWGYVVLDGGGFTCCGGTLHHAGLFAAQAEVRRRNIERWRDMGRPVIAAFCASCKHGLDAYAEEGGMEPEEAALWKRQVRGLSALLAAPVCETVPDAPARIGYHQPCHWGEDDPDLPFLRQAFPLIMKGTGLCCGMGGILKMTDADVSAMRGGLRGLPPYHHRMQRLYAATGFRSPFRRDRTPLARCGGYFSIIHYFICFSIYGTAPSPLGERR